MIIFFFLLHFVYVSMKNKITQIKLLSRTTDDDDSVAHLKWQHAQFTIYFNIDNINIEFTDSVVFVGILVSRLLLLLAWWWFVFDHSCRFYFASYLSFFRSLTRVFVFACSVICVETTSEMIITFEMWFIRWKSDRTLKCVTFGVNQWIDN